MPKRPGPVHIPFEQIREMIDSQDRDFGIRRARYRLREEDTAWNPVSTKGELHGPCVVTYVRYEDGAYEAQVQ